MKRRRCIIQPSGIKAINFSSTSSSFSTFSPSTRSLMSENLPLVLFSSPMLLWKGKGHLELTDHFVVSELDTDISVGRIVGSGTSAALLYFAPLEKKTALNAAVGQQQPSSISEIKILSSRAVLKGDMDNISRASVFRPSGCQVDTTYHLPSELEQRWQ